MTFRLRQIRKYAIFWKIALGVFALDQLTKLLVIWLIQV